MQIQRTIIASLALSLAACGGAVGPDDLESQQPAGKASQVGGGGDPAQLVFSRDDRPVDGDLVEIVLSQDALGTYDASLRRAYFDRLGGQPVDTTRELGTRLSCTFSATSVACARDQRPVDGALTELEIAATSAGRWDATLHSAWVNMITGQPVDQTDTVASRLIQR